jgi:putative colanic acid biosynthesis acetyltransferase WcaF
MVERPRVQDLESFVLPRHFRGRSSAFVQMWWLVQGTLFRASPQVMYGFRRWLLRLFGARIGKKVLIRPTAEITYPWKVRIGDYSWIGDHAVLYSLGDIVIGKHCVISQRSYLCTGTHDHNRPTFDISAHTITVEDEAWLAADVYVAPGITVGRGAVIGARSSIFRDLPPMWIYLGSPARAVKPRLPSNSAG